MDTGCDDNLITMEVLERAGIDKAQIIEIPAEEQVELEGLETAKCIPIYETTLQWYQDGDIKMRNSKFYVVKEGPFDMLIGSRRFAQELKPGLLAAGRKKRRAEREQERLKEEEHARREREAEKLQRETEAISGANAAGVRPANTPQATLQPCP